MSCYKIREAKLENGAIWQIKVMLYYCVDFTFPNQLECTSEYLKLKADWTDTHYYDDLGGLCIA